MPASDVRLEDLDVAALAYAQERTPRARETFIRECLPFAGRLARRYRGRGELLDDLEQAARVGLVKAVDRYDPERGSFTAYAVVTISGELRRHFRDRTWGVHVPRRVQELALEVGQVSTLLTATLARTPTAAEIAAQLKVPEDVVVDALESAAGYTPASLNTPVVGRDGQGEMGDLIGQIDADLESLEDRITASGLLLRLPERERRILALRFYGNRTQAEIAAELGLSQMHVSRLLARTLAWLREAMLSDSCPRWDGQAADAPTTLRVRVGRSGDAVVVRLTGEVDRDEADRLRVALRRAVSAADRVVVVDLGEVPLIDAGGVAVLLDAANAAAVAGVALRLAGPQAYVLPVLKVTGLAPLIHPGLVDAP